MIRVVDRAAKARRITRSRLVGEVLRRLAARATDEEISRRVDEVLADPEIGKEQRETAAGYRRIRPHRGTEW